MLVYYFVFAIFGLCLGSFANVLIARMPKGQSISFPASHCPKCKHKLRFYHNIPLFSWIFLGGKCAFCKDKISIIYPFVELSGAILAALAFYICQKNFGGDIYENIQNLCINATFLTLCFICLLALSLIDFEFCAIPENLLLFSFFFALASKFENLNQFFMEISSPFYIGLMFMGGIFFLKSLVSAWINRNNKGEIIESMGEGDVMIFGVIGTLCGAKLGFEAILIAGILQLIFHLILRGKKEEIPFVPALSAACIISLTFNEYLDFLNV